MLLEQIGVFSHLTVTASATYGYCRDDLRLQVRVELIEPGEPGGLRLTARSLGGKSRYSIVCACDSPGHSPLSHRRYGGGESRAEVANVAVMRRARCARGAPTLAGCCSPVGAVVRCL